jgi:transposase
MSNDDIKKEISGNKALKRAKDRLKLLEQSISNQAKELDRLRKLIEHKDDRIEKLEDEIKSLRGVVPEFVKPKVARSSNGGSSSKRGPKKGHLPAKRQRPDESKIDFDVHIMPKTCSDCDNKLPTPHKFHSHVQIDIPEVSKPIVTEFHVGWSWCKCCQGEKSCNFKLAGSLYGPRLHAFVAYLKFDQGLTLGKIRDLIAQMYDLEISTGVLSEMVVRTGQDFSPVCDQLKDSLLKDKALYADETGWRVDGENKWLWSFSSQTTSYYTIVSSRGQKVVENALGKSFDGTLISDFYGGYNRIDSKKQRCWAHLLRDVKKLEDDFPDDKQLQLFARRLKSLFNRGVILRDQKLSGEDIAKPLLRLKNSYHKLSLTKANKYYLKTLCKRLLKFRREMLTFIEEGCEPTNNNAEREIRPAVLMRKTSYQNSSQTGADTQAVMMSVIRTAKKRNINFLKMASSYLAQDFRYQ